MNKRIFLALLTVLFVMFSLSAVCASDVNVTDAGTVGLADDSADASAMLEMTADSSEISQSNSTDFDEDSTVLSASNEEMLESDSNEVIITAGKISIKEILIGANNLKDYYNLHGVLPTGVTAGGTTYTIPEFYYLMNKATAQLVRSDSSAIEPIMGVKGPSSKCTDTVYTAAVATKSYTEIADATVTYIAKNKQVASYVNAVAGKIAYEDYVTLVARVLSYRYLNGEMPNYVAFYSNDPSKVKYEEKGEKNAFGLYGKNVWIDADGGSDAIKWKIANALKEAGWNVYVGDTYANAHWEDYLNAKPGYVLINIYNGFCAGTMRELVTDSIQNLLDTKHIVCVPVWDTSDWTEGMKPYRYGNFTGYSAKRAWDDDFSYLDPSIDDVDEFFRFYGVDYCAYPTVAGIVDQFEAGGYYKYHGEDEDKGKVSVSDVVNAAVTLKKSIEDGIYPSVINVGGESHTTPQLLYMMAQATILINSGKTSTKIDAVQAKGPSSHANTASGQLAKSKYITVANNLVNYITKNGHCPGYADSDLGKIGYPELIDAFSRILAYYKNNGNTLPNTVAIIPSLKLVAEYKDDAVIATVSDANGNAVKGLKVGFAFDGVKYVTTDANGQAKYSTAGLSDDDIKVTVRAYGGDKYKDSNKQTVTVPSSKTATTLTAKYDASSKSIVATVTDAKGNGVSGLKVGFALDGVKYVLSDAKGVARYSVADLPDNTYTATIQAYGNDVYKNSNKQTVTFTVGDKKQTKIFLRNALYFALETKIVQVTLWDANNKPLSGKTVHIELNEYGLKYSGVTDENGDAYIRVGVGFGVHDATVSFDGDSSYLASQRTGSIRVIKETPSVMVRGADTQFKVSDTKIVKVHLRDRYDKPLPANSKIAIKVNGQTFIGYTDADGVASIKITLNSVGVFAAQAVYGGNSAYNDVTRDIKITVTR